MLYWIKIQASFAEILNRKITELQLSTTTPTVRLFAKIYQLIFGTLDEIGPPERWAEFSWKINLTHIGRGECEALLIQV